MKAIQAVLLLAFTLGAFEVCAQSDPSNGSNPKPKPSTEKPKDKKGDKKKDKESFNRSKPVLIISTQGIA